MFRKQCLLFIALGTIVMSPLPTNAQSGGSITTFEFSSVAMDYPTNAAQNHFTSLQGAAGQSFLGAAEPTFSQGNTATLGFLETSVKYIYRLSFSLDGFVGDVTQISLSARLWNVFGEMADTTTVQADASGLMIVRSWANPTYVGTASLKGDRWLRRSSSLSPIGNPFLDYPFASYSLIPGDVTGDNTIDRFDYNAFKNAFGTSPGNPNWNPMADLDGDGVVGRFDYNIFKLNFGKTGDN
ncbi:dockerin type I domain-containing protein [Armatimonas sp.]|uniref:dockerin type I domain-containing protein n=1 Tax=Armatimonas sp. TaxID=1872638 RepID=UPI00286A2DF4|nr:dockerin type I domain-containing protein [Armatimonas sp.]